MKCSWLENAIFYEIYPNSFKDNNNDGYGDFKGIISKLDYLKNLGINAIWINPHYDSPFMDGGYDVRDFLLAYFRNNDLIIINPTILEKQIELNSIKELVFKEGNITIKDQKLILGGQSIVIVRI